MHIHTLLCQEESCAQERVRVRHNPGDAVRQKNVDVLMHPSSGHEKRRLCDSSATESFSESEYF